MPVSKQKQTERRTLEVGRVEGCVDGERKLFWLGEQRQSIQSAFQRVFPTSTFNHSACLLDAPLINLI